jgi:hypothetical protein
MATEISFVVGFLQPLERRVLAALRILLLALRVIDNLGVILVIALLHSNGLGTAGLLAAALGLVALCPPDASAAASRPHTCPSPYRIGAAPKALASTPRSPAEELNERLHP